MAGPQGGDECEDCKLQSVLRELPAAYTLTPGEVQAASECSWAARRWCLPGTALGSLAAYGLLRAGLLLGRRHTVVKAAVGGALGYYVAIVQYVHSGDCAERFHRLAPRGEVVRRLGLRPMCPDCRQGMEITDERYHGELERLAGAARERELGREAGRRLRELDFTDYVIPGEEAEERARILGDTA